jgi:hypothetical protein
MEDKSPKRSEKFEQEGLKRIEQRASKSDNDYYRTFSTQKPDPLNNFVERHFKSLAYISVESTHNIFFHFVDTVKVRAQARNLKSGDISHYFKNKV